ncbi:HIT family protein [Extibacter muris]|uniref:HIT family protein n=1 Tax=Extibacter muris TaxID=1796622 RepID=UPI001D097E38|nr:HIT domain-containing protein [Extibacter muris]MCB6200859.1 HIT domain-containing protein [Extibacter muris]MCQ4662189.1 HIT domain-containing protein [Extibacter muris]MCQ4691897.1 HIT domain-containing protein [Extibacter muris]
MSCVYCEEGISTDLIRIGNVKKHTLYLHRDQTYPGRCILAARQHIKKVTDLSGEEYLELCGEVYTAAEILNRLFTPDKINFVILGDCSEHLHVHIVPKYVGKKNWGKLFEMNEGSPVCLKEKEYEAMRQRILKELEKEGAVQ